MVGFLLVKRVFHTVQLSNAGEHKTGGGPCRRIWPPTWGVGQESFLEEWW